MGGKNTEDVRALIAKLGEERRETVERMAELGSWLMTAGEKATHKKDKMMRKSFLRERERLQRKTMNIDTQIMMFEEMARTGKSDTVVVGSVEALIGEPDEVHEVFGDVSDHALVRWMERKYGVDVESMRKDMYLDMKSALEASGFKRTCRGCIIVKGEDMTYVHDPKADKIVTCYKDHETLARESGWMQVIGDE